MEKLISIIFLAATTVAYLVVAALASRGVKSKDGYLLGNRQFRTFSITLTLIATQLGAGMLFGTATEAYSNGISGIAYVLGMACGLIILGLGVGAKLRSLNVTTTAEIFETKYGSKKLRKLAALISILTMGGILAAQIVASRQLFSSLFDINPVWLIAFWIVIIAYTTFGGLKAIVATDILQVFMIVSVFTVVLFFVIPVNQFGPTLLMPSEFNTPLFSGGFFAALIMPILFSLIEQDLAQRCFAAKTPRIAALSSMLAAVFLLMYAFVPILLGMYAKSTGITFIAGQSPLVLLLQSKLSSFGMTVVSCALLAAICSTADSLLGAASSNLIGDFLPEGKFSLPISRLLSFLLGIAALIIAFNFDNVISIIIKSYEISISALFIPLILAMYLKNPKKRAAGISVTLGIATFMLAQIMKAPISPTFLALVVSGCGYMVGIFLPDNKPKFTRT